MQSQTGKVQQDLKQRSLFKLHQQHLFIASRWLQQVEDSFFVLGWDLEQLRSELARAVAVPAANYDAYPPDVQRSIVCLQCWAMPAEWDGEYRRVLEFADKALQWARERKDGLTEAGLLTCLGFHQQLLGI